MTQPLIWALDVATVTGFAIGRAGDKPTALSVRLAQPEADRNVLFSRCLHWFEGLLDRNHKPDILVIEELLPPNSMRGRTSTMTQHRLAGLHGVVRAVAHHHKIPEIVGVNVQDVRQHFIHRRNLTRDEAKREILKTCQMLGWLASDNNAGDALALWSYTAGLLNPASAMATTPLFGSWEEVARARGAKQ